MLTTYVSKTDRTIECDESDINKAGIAYLKQYGFKQALGDCHSQIKRDDYKAGDAGTKEFQAAVNKAVDAKLAAIKAGTIRVGGGGGRTTDPVAKELKRLLALQLAARKVKTAEARKYTLEAWATEFADDPEAAMTSLRKQAVDNVASDLAFIASMKAPKVAKTK